MNVCHNATNSTNHVESPSESAALLKPHHNAIYTYAAIPDLEHPDQAGNRELRDFYTYRHLSRQERVWRETHHVDLHLDWDGHYDDAWEEAWVLTTENLERSWHSNNSSAKTGNTTVPRRLASASASSSTSTIWGGQMNNYQSVPLSQGYGTHFANIWVGSVHSKAQNKNSAESRP